MLVSILINLCKMSLSARRAWIEIPISIADFWISVVALRKESVDRNIILAEQLDRPAVALRKESVDRNVFVYGS